MMINKLVKILIDETALYETLFHIVTRERKAMTTYNLTELIQCQNERQTINLDVARLQERRVAVLNEISITLGIPVERLNISTLLKSLKSEEANSLEECRNNLIDVIKKLSEAEAGNRNIVRRSLLLIDESVRVLTGFTSSDPNYLSNGALGKNDNPGCRVRKEA